MAEAYTKKRNYLPGFKKQNSKLKTLKGSRFRKSAKY